MSRHVIDQAPHTPATSSWTPTALKLIFTLVQTWAIVTVVIGVRVEGALRIALALALAGAIMAVIDTWRVGDRPDEKRVADKERQPKSN